MQFIRPYHFYSLSSVITVLPLAIIILALPMAVLAEPAADITACNQALQQQQPQQALKLADAVLKQTPAQRDAMLCKGRALTQMAQHSAALALFQQAEQLAASPLDHVISLYLVGNSYKAMAEPAQALEAYQAGIAYADAAKIKRYQLIGHHLAGDLHMEKQAFDLALQAYQRASAYAANGNERADNYGHIAAAHAAKQQFNQAIEFQIKSLMMEKQNADLEHQAHAELELGKMYSQAREAANAEKSIQHVIDLGETYGSAYWKAKGLWYLAEHKVRVGQPDEAKQLLQSALASCREGCESPQLLADMEQALKNLH